MPHTLRMIGGRSGTWEEVLPGVTAIKTGGHFPGSLVLHWQRKLFIADTIVTVPVGPCPVPFSKTRYDSPFHCFYLSAVQDVVSHSLVNE